MKKKISIVGGGNGGVFTALSLSWLNDDYEVELWNPALTFYQKSPDTRYISDGNYVGKCEMVTVSDVIDCYG